MSIRTKLVAFAAILVLLVGGQSQASFVGSLGLAGTATSDSPSNLAASKTYTTGNLVVLSSSGIFSSVTGPLSPITINVNGSNPFSIVFTGIGTFTETGLTIAASSTTSESFLISGTFTPATTGPAAGMGVETASLNMSFTANGSTANGSGVMNVPAVPEPASISMIVLGLGGVFAARRFRRRAA
jgi:hypothetical protein